MASDIKDMTGTVYVWLANLREIIESLLDDRGEFDVHPGLDLSELDRKDIARRVKARDQASLAARRIVRNAILHKYLPGSHLGISRGPNGKPSWRERFFFNGSQSGTFFAFALSEGQSIGIDLEGGFASDGGDDPQKRFENRTKVAELFFKPEERAFLAQFETSGLRIWHREFLRLWTRKEAAVKCWGKSIESHCFEVDALRESFEWQGKRWYFRTIELSATDLGSNFPQGRHDPSVEWGLWLTLCSADHAAIHKSEMVILRDTKRIFA